MYNPTNVQTFGTFYFLDAIAKKINLYDDLYSVFNDKTKYILTLTFYMLTRSKAIKYIDYWCEENYNYLSTPLIFQRVSELFASISFDDRISFLKKWSKHIKESEYIDYDVTKKSLH